MTIDIENFDVDLKKTLNGRGFYRLDVRNEKPALEADEEIMYKMSRDGIVISKEYMKKKISEDLPADEKITSARKFSKLKLYGICAQLGHWQKLTEWMSGTTTPTGIRLKDAFDYAQELSEDHPLFESYFKLACKSCGISDEEGKMILNQSALDA